MRAVKSLKQSLAPSAELLDILEQFRLITNECVRIGLEKGITSMKVLSMEMYHHLDCSYSAYRLCAISRAAGIISSYTKSTRRGLCKSPCCQKLMLVSCYGFKVKGGELIVPLAPHRHASIALNNYTKEVLSDPSIKVRSFTLTTSTLSICYSKEITEIKCTKTVGVDRNLRNITAGNKDHVAFYKLPEAVKVAKRTKKVVASFKRNDVRIRKGLASKYGKRRRNRINQMFHRVTKAIVANAVKNKEAIVLEYITNIRRLYRKGNGQGSRHRGMMNSWSFGEAQRQLEYKAKWQGLPVIKLSRGETMGTSSICPICGERLLNGQGRKVHCRSCGYCNDRDATAAINIAKSGLPRFSSPLPAAKAKGATKEAMKGNPPTTTGAIPVADVAKPAELGHLNDPTS